MPLSRGSVYRYNYLWSREHDKNEVSGRKARPVCLLIRSPASPAALFLFPLTSQKPRQGTLALEIPDSECQRANLVQPCWIIVDEYNRANEEDLYDFETLAPIGQFSLPFLKRVGLAVANASSSKRLRAVPRS